MKDKKLIFLLIMLAAILLSAVFAPLIAPYSPYEIDLSNRFAPISQSHILGTDHLGRDVFSRLIYGSRMSLISVLAIMVIILLISLIIGCAAGFQGGKIDNVLMRISDVMLTFPTFILALFFIGVLGVCNNSHSIYSPCLVFANCKKYSFRNKREKLRACF